MGRLFLPACRGPVSQSSRSRIRSITPQARTAERWRCLIRRRSGPSTTVVANNIAFVIGLGDIVQDGNLNGNFFEWANADSAVSLLDNPATTGLPQGIPYSFGVGNHDQGPNGNGGQPNDTAGYNQYFGISRYSGKSYYGGHYGTQNDNHYELFSAGGMDFIVINLAYDVSARSQSFWRGQMACSKLIVTGAASLSAIT